MNPRKRLGEMLLEAGVIDETQLKAALGHQRQWGVRIGQALVDLKLATEHDIVVVLAQKYGFEVARLDGIDPSALGEALKHLPRDFAQRNNVLPIAVDTGSITVAMSDPSNLAIADEVRFRTGRKVKVCIGGDREIAEAVGRYYPGEAPVEAIALDLEGDDSSGEALHDPFGGGSRDALEAFFSANAESAGAVPAPAPPAATSAPAPHPAPPPPGPVAAQPAVPPAASRPASPSSPPAARAATGTAQKPQPPAAQRAAPPRPPASAPKAPPPVPAPTRPTGKFPIPSASATPVTSTAVPAAVPPKAPAPPPQVAAAQRVDEARAELLGTVPPGGLSPWGEPEPLHEAQQGAGDGADGGTLPGAPGGRPLTPSELSILDALERLAGGAHAEPEIVKPMQAMAAMIRLLLRKRVVTEQEFLDELSKK